MTLWAIYALEVIAIGILRIPHDLGLFMFAFGDRGSWLVAQFLTAHGARPTIDFGFPYGLLPLLFGRAWFAMFGLTPAAFNAAMMTGGVAMAFGMARFANAMRLNRVGQLLIVVALPVAIQSSMPGLSHLLEAVALCLAIGEHARGNRGAALALATAACFATAALGYLYGFLLVGMIVAHCRRRATADTPARFDWLALRRTLMPAAVIALILLAIVGPVFGVRPLIASLLPLNGMKIYRTQHFGFFTPWSRTFWDPRAQPLGLYFATVAPFWLGSTIWLALAGLLAGSHLFGWHLFPASRLRCPFPNNDSAAHRRDEIVFCCAVLQTLFVLRFFGPPTSWTYYPYIVVMGVVAASVMNSITARVTMLLVFVAFVAQDASLVAASSQWKTSTPSASTAGLWADAGDRAEWSTVTRLISGPRTGAVGVAGAPSTTVPRPPTASPASPSRPASSASRPMRRDESAGIVTNEVSDSEPAARRNARATMLNTDPTAPLLAPEALASPSTTQIATATPPQRPRAVALGVAGAASILFPQFEKPIGAYLVRDEATPAEVARIIEQIKAADFVVRPASVSIGDPIYAWPEMTRAFDKFQVIWKGQTFQVCRHR